MLRIRNAISKPKYRNVVTGIFFLSVIVCGVGSILLSIEYLAVYDTANRFLPHVTRLQKSSPTPSTRLLTIDLQVGNNGTRMVHIFRYDILVYIRNPTDPDRYHQVYIREFHEDVYLLPGNTTTLRIMCLIEGGYAQRVIDAENAGQLNWFILHPMRVWFGEWLNVRMSYLGTPWIGAEEV
jgi:hypothetical protein